MILSAQTIRRLCLASPPLIAPAYEKTVYAGMTFGISEAGYDVRIAEDVILYPANLISLLLGRKSFVLASTIEQFHIPDDIMFIVADKSSWARQGLAVQNTRGEPGWHGFLTLELSYHGSSKLRIRAGQPIAQIIFQRLDQPTSNPYTGKYQGQLSGPQPAIFDWR